MGSSYTYKDPSTENVITKRDLNSMAWRSLLLQASFNYERMQAGGWLYSLLPGLKKIHKNKEDLANSMKMHLEFFNTHPFLVTFIMGIVIAMEERKEDLNTIRAIKVATMGPLGGIGDAICWLTLLPITAGIGASLAIEGNIAGPFIFFILLNIVHFALRFGLMNYGYSMGVSAIEELSEQTKTFSRAVTIVGLIVVGALIASYVSLETPLAVTVGKANIELQTDLLDQIMPKLLPVVYTFWMYKLLKKGRSPIILIVITVAIGIVGKLLTIL